MNQLLSAAARFADQDPKDLRLFKRIGEPHDHGGSVLLLAGGTRIDPHADPYYRPLFEAVAGRLEAGLPVTLPSSLAFLAARGLPGVGVYSWLYGVPPLVFMPATDHIGRPFHPVYGELPKVVGALLGHAPGELAVIERYEPELGKRRRRTELHDLRAKDAPWRRPYSLDFALARSPIRYLVTVAGDFVVSVTGLIIPSPVFLAIRQTHPAEHVITKRGYAWLPDADVSAALYTNVVLRELPDDSPPRND